MDRFDAPAYGNSITSGCGCMAGPRAHEGHGAEILSPTGAPGRSPKFFRRREQTPVAIPAPSEAARWESIRLPVIVPCPACDGGGHVFRDGSQVSLACRLCWERGVVARIVADQYSRAD